VSVLFPEEPDDFVEQILPSDDEPLAEDEELAELEDSLDTLPDEDDLIITAPPPDPVGRSWAYDFQHRHFVHASGGHAPVATFGEATMRGWIEKVLHTDRGAHPIHPDEYGIERSGGIFGGPVAQFPTGDYEHRIREALLFHPRIVDVGSFAWDIDPMDEAISCEFVVTLDDETEIELGGVRVVG
jgi:hypothetical protein